MKTGEHIKRIDVKSLQMGMFIHKLGGAWTDNPFWRTSFRVDTFKQLRQVQLSSIRELWIDLNKGVDVAPVAPEVSAEMYDDPVEVSLPAAPALLIQEDVSPPVSLSEEMGNAAKICAQGLQAVTSMFQEVRMGKAIHTSQVMPLVEEMTTSVLRNQHALISLARLKNKDDYTYMHSVAVCALMIALARQLNFDAARIRIAGMAGLLHDIGKMMIPPEILNKPGKLTAFEFGTVKNHPVQGHQILMEAQGISEEILDVCLHHHERFDGNGYPHGLKGEQISLFARMGAICDVYDAITSNRAYREGWEPSESIRTMAQWSGTHFDPELFQAFVKCIGIYPTGTLVRLTSERLGIVIEQSMHSLLTPIVKVFYSIKSNTHIPPEVLDFHHLVGIDKILGIEDAATWGLTNLNALWTEG